MPVKSRSRPYQCLAGGTVAENLQELESGGFLAYSDRNTRKEAGMFSGLILGMGLGLLGLIIFSLHKEHGPEKHDH